MDAYPYLAPGDTVTLDTLTGLTGLTGEVVAVDLNPDGTLRCLSVRDVADRPEPLRIRGDLIALWRKGAPLRRSSPAQQLAVPAGVLPMPGANGGR